MNISNYSQAIQSIKEAILKSRYRAASLANKELLQLYFTIGEYVSINTRNKNWGKGAIEIISDKLQQELPGLKGFSATNIKSMRLFYETWELFFINRPPLADEIEIRQLATAEFENRPLSTDELQSNENRQPVAVEFNNEQKNMFLRVGFTHHREIIAKTKSFVERMFYIERCAT